MYSRTRIKMCGTTSFEDGYKAALLGVDAIGMIFADKSPRYISPSDAFEITNRLPPLLTKIGVFVSERIQEIEEIVLYLGLNGVQLHGDEDPDFCEKLSQSLPSCFIFKAVRVGSHTTSEDFKKYNDVVSGFVLDTYVKGTPGGTGESFDWNILRQLIISKPYLLAGGLSPENIENALQAAGPFGVDINSGVEFAPGRKNMEKMKSLTERVRKFDAEKQ